MKHKTNKTSRPLVTVLTVILVVFAVLAFLFRDELNAETIQRLFGREDSSWAGEEAFSYESGGEQVFALSGDGLAAASVTGLQLLDSDGKTVARQVFSMDQPSVAVSPVLCAFFDVGGTALRTAGPDGTVTDLDTEDTIISVSVNENGYLAVTTEEQGYKGCVTVYSPELEPLYRWHAGTGYTLSARVSPAGSQLVVNCLTE
ncbi:MAG: DUF5711 family protein, partial [Eubacteriales bacterium]|nr:DUF5711 family protein [Eubacteriales bacterium]